MSSCDTLRHHKLRSTEPAFSEMLHCINNSNGSDGELNARQNIYSSYQTGTLINPVTEEAQEIIRYYMKPLLSRTWLINRECHCIRRTIASAPAAAVGGAAEA